MDPNLCLTGIRLPPYARIVVARKDYLVGRIPRFHGAHQFAVLWDPQRDELVLSVMSALSYRDLDARDAVLALTMLRGKLTIWTGWSEPHRVERLQEIVRSASDSVLNPIRQKWDIEPPLSVPMVRSQHGPIMDREALPPEHPLLVIPSAYQLGGVSK